MPGANTSSSPRTCLTFPKVERAVRIAALAQQTLKIINKRGLHARAAAKFAALAEEFDAGITVSNGRESVGGRSIMGLLLLGAAQGTEITVQSEGADADAALSAIAALVADGFGEIAD